MINILEFFSKNQKLIIFGGLLLAALFFIDKPLGVALLFVVFLTAVSLFFIDYIKDPKEKKVLSVLFLIVFFLHILGVLFIYYTHFQPFSGGGGDYILYQGIAETIAQRIDQGNFSLHGLDYKHFFPVIVGYVYAFTLPNMLIGQLFNAWIVALIIIFVYFLVRQLGGSQKEAFLTGLIGGVYPSLAFYGSLLLKDAIVVLLCMAGLFLMLKIAKHFSVIKFTGFFIVLTILIHFRFYVGFAMMFCFGICWFLTSNFNLKKRIRYGLFLVFLLGFSPQILGLGYYGYNNFKSFLNIERITMYRELVFVPPSQRPQPKPEPQIQPTPEPTSTTTPKPTPIPTPTPSVEPVPASDSIARASSVVVKTGFENPISFVRNSTISFVYAFLGPFPWQLKKLSQAFVLPEVLAWYVLLFFIIKGIWSFIKKRDLVILPLIIFSALVVGVLALYISNFGVMTRIRMPTFLALLCIFPFGFLKLKTLKIPFLEKLFNE